MPARMIRTCVLGGLAMLAVTGPVLSADPNFEEVDVDVWFSLYEENPGDVLGYVADPIGDINEDGVPDIVTSAPFQFNGGNVTGKAYVISGADGSVLNSIVGNPGEYLGYSATLAGDVNNDGTNDYILGSRARALVVSGSDHSILYEWAIPGVGFGFDSNTAGDLNEDGYDDVLVGAPFASDNGPSSGTMYAYSGMDGSMLWSFSGDEGSNLGLGVGPVGDINDDGVPDVVVAAANGGNSHKGIAFVLSGTDGNVLLELDPKAPSAGAKGPNTFGVYHIHGAGDINNDGVPDIYAGDYNSKSGQHNPRGTHSVGSGRGRAFVFSGADGSLIWRIEGEEFGDGMGPGRGVPDMNGDGHDDIFVAAWAYGQGDDDTDVGKGYLISGADGEVIRTMTGTVPYGYIGVDAASIEDVNGDGLTDYILTGWGFLHVVLGN